MSINLKQLTAPPREKAAIRDALQDEGVPVLAPERRRVLVAVRWPVGGIRTHVLYNYPTLARRGYLFTFVGPGDETLNTFRQSLSGIANTEFMGVAVKGKRCALWREVRRQLRTGRYNGVHSHGLTAAVHAATANIGLNYPHVATLHDVFRPCHFDGLLGPIKRRTLSYLLNQVHTIISVSEDVRRNLLEYLPMLRRRSDSIVTVLNGVDFGDEAAAPCYPSFALRKRSNLPREIRLLGFLGRFMEQKGFLPLLHALRQLADTGTSVPFHLVAVGSGDYRKEYAATLGHLGLGNLVTFVDFMPDVRPVLADLDLLVIPSQWEASSLLAMEAMAAGVPILGTDCIGLREVLQDTPARTVPVGDTSALAEGLRAALETPWTDEARAFAVRARVRFDNAPSAAKLANLIDVRLRQRRR